MTMDAQRMRLRERMRRDAAIADRTPVPIHRPVFRTAATVRDMVIGYVLANPDATVRGTAAALGLERDSVRRYWPRENISLLTAIPDAGRVSIADVNDAQPQPKAK